MNGNRIIKILLIIFIITTLSLATIVTIIIASGGKFTDQGVITNTGTLRIKTDPDNISYVLFINDVRTDVIDKRVTGLVEGKYRIRIEADNYTTWEKEITLTNDLVTEIIVKLYPKNVSITQLTKTNIDSIFYSSEGEYLYYVVLNSEFNAEKGIWKMPIGSNNIFFNNTDPVATKILSFDENVSLILKTGQYSLKASNDNNKLLLLDSTTDNFYIVSDNRLTSVNKLVGFNPERVEWFNGSTNIIVTHQNLILDYNLNNNVATVVKYLPQGELIYALNPYRLIILDQNLQTFEEYQNQKLVKFSLNKLTLPNDLDEIYMPPIAINVFYLHSISQGYLYINLDKAFSTKLINQDHSTTIERISNDGNSIIYKNLSAMYLFTANENKALNQIEIEENKFSTLDLITSNYYAYTPQSSHIIIIDSTSKTLNIVEKDGSNFSKIMQDNGISLKANLNVQGNYIYISLKVLDNINIYRIKLTQS